jgi:hypothetical protein
MEVLPVLVVEMFEMFTPERTTAAFQWVDGELSGLLPEASFIPWWSLQLPALESRLPPDATQGVIPRNLPDKFKTDMTRYVLLHEMFYELTNGPAGGTGVRAGDLDGTLPALEGGWGMTPEGGLGRVDDVLRWFRGWWNGMLSDLGGMIADVQDVTGSEDVEVAPGVRMRIDPEYLRSRASSEAAPASKVSEGSMPSKLKVCPDCTSNVGRGTRKCRYCGYRFDVDRGP